MRDSYNPPRYTTILIGVLIGAYLLQSFFLFYGHFDTFGLLGLTASGLFHGRIWQLLTFQFLHSTPWPWHLLFNCIGLHFFGRPIEETLGSRRFLALYFLSGLVGGLVQITATALLPHHPDVPVVGASAGVCGLLAVFCSLHPTREITTFIVVFPVNIRAQYFLWFMGLLSLFGTIFPFDLVAHGAHLGGMLVGVSYVRWFLGSEWWTQFWSRLRRPRRAQPIMKVRFPKTTGPAQLGTGLGDAPGTNDFISKEVDPILEKISAQGIQSLTEHERRILEAARSKMERR